MTGLLEFCRAREGWLLDLVEELVRHESPSTDKTAVDACGRVLADRLSQIGARVSRLPRREAGDLVRAELGDGPSQALLLGHFDTVWPVGQLARMPLHQENGRLYGPGVYDMKAGIGIAMLAAQALLATSVVQRRLVMLWTTDEEIGSRASRAPIEAEARASEVVLVLEPSLPGGGVKTSRKGCGEFELVVRGVAAHAGIDPGSGASAVHELARQIVALEGLQDPARGVSVNVGVIAGGTRPNVVAEEARAVVDVRVRTRADGEQVEQQLRALAPVLRGTSLHVTGGFGRPPLERSPAVAALYGRAREIARQLGSELGEGGTGGGSDGNFTAALGVPTLDGLGAVGGGAHALDEHVERASLPVRAALVAGLLEGFGEA